MAAASPSLTKESLQGLIPALVTPFFGDNAALDLQSYEKLISFVLAGGAGGVVACGSTGEAVALDENEYAEVVRCAVAATRGKGSCIAGVGASSTSRAIEMAQRAEKSGADGILLVTPPYNKPPQEGIVEHFRQVKNAISIPIVAYNVPGRTGVNLLPKTVHALAQQGLIVALKESSGSMDQVADISALVGSSISLLSGEDSLVVPTIALGGKGVISVTGNCIPALVSQMVAAANNGDFASARRLQLQTLPITRLMFSETNPIPVKAALALLGVIRSDAVRLPLLPAQLSTKTAIKAELSNLEAASK